MSYTAGEFNYSSSKEGKCRLGLCKLLSNHTRSVNCLGDKGGSRVKRQNGLAPPKKTCISDCSYKSQTTHFWRMWQSEGEFTDFEKIFTCHDSFVQLIYKMSIWLHAVE